MVSFLLVSLWGREMNTLGRFKLFLDPTSLRDGEAVDLPLPKLPPGKRAIDLIIDFLGCLWDVSIFHWSIKGMDLTVFAPVR
jgi:hypothetical protein